MINWIWVIMILAGIISFILNKNSEMLIKTMTDSAQSSIEFLIILGGIMSIWSGIMKLCEKSGMIEDITKILKYPMRILFPGLEKKSESALGNIIMNVASNMLGISNAATPFGIKAMDELQKINTRKDRASDYMVTFLIINSACIQFIPSTVISIRGSLGALNSSDIIIPTILSTLVALVIGLISNIVLKKIFSSK